MVCPVCKHETTSFLFCQLCDSYLPNVAAGTKAGFGRRLGAVFLDGIAFWVIFGVVMLLSGLLAAGGMAAGGGSQDAAALAGLGWMAAMFWAFVGYFVFLLWFLAKGKTPGKWLLGIQVVDKRNGNFPGLGRMIVREIFGKWVSGFFLGLGYLWAVFDRDGQAWHDKIAGTLVLRLPSSPALAAATTSGAITQAQAPAVAQLSAVNAVGFAPPPPRPPANSVTGQQIPTFSFCNGCGKAVKSEDRFCQHCGTARANAAMA